MYNQKKRAKITDFGCVKIRKETLIRDSTGMRGTIGFMAPEILAAEPFDEKADIYSYVKNTVNFWLILTSIRFGVLLFEMATNTSLPILDREKLHRRITDNIRDIDLRQLIIQCCDHDPKMRPNTERCIKILKKMKGNVSPISTNANNNLSDDDIPLLLVDRSTLS